MGGGWVTSFRDGLENGERHAHLRRAKSTVSRLLESKEMIDPWTAVLVFTAAALIDGIGTMDIRRTAQGKAGAAAFYTMVGYLLGGVTLWVFVHNPWYIVPEILGAGIGAYITIKWDSRIK